jgi:hypothetical protein
MPTTFNTTDPKPGYVYDSATDTWFPLLGIAPGSSIVRWRFTAVGGETSVSGLDDLGATLSYNAGTEQVYLNGVLLVRTEDYTATNGTSVTALNALAASDVIEVISFNATNVQITDALLETDINAKGDLIVGAAVDTATILASGTNGQVLKVNTATTSGLEWGTLNADIEGVTAGTGLTGGGTSGTVTLALDSAAVIAPTIVNAKGDLISASADNTPAILSVGTNGQVLTAASGQTTGLQWTTPSAGGMTLLTTNTVSGAGFTISGISQDYTDLLIIMDGITSSTLSPIYFMPNGVTDFSFSIRTNTDSATVASVFRSRSDSPTTANNGVMCIYFNLYSATNIAKPVRYWGGSNDSSGFAFSGNGYWGNDTALSSFKIEAVDNPAYTLGGTIRVYGVK